MQQPLPRSSSSTVRCCSTSASDKNAALFYQSIVSAFCRLGYRIIAEGVETQEEMELLRSWNVDMIQGYYFSRPLPPGDLARLLTEEAVEQM